MFRSFLFLFFLVKFSSSQSASCNFIFNRDGWYQCDLLINNPNGIEISSIEGTHLPGMTNLQVWTLNFLPESSTKIVPQIICTQFPNIQIFFAQNAGIKILTATSFSNCRNMWNLDLQRNPIEEVNENTFSNNWRLTQLLMSQTLLNSLPSNLFRDNARLQMFSIYNSPHITDIAPQFFSFCPLLYYIRLSGNSLTFWHPQWLATAPLLQTLLIYSNDISNLPRNAIISSRLRTIIINGNNIREIDFFSFSDISSVRTVFIDNNPIEAIDFNFIDRAKSLVALRLLNVICTSVNFNNFHENREENMKILEPCFEAFDRRIMKFQTSNSTPFFNSIRKEAIKVSIKTSSDAILTFSNSPDGSGSNFEIHLSNSVSKIFENGIEKSSSNTPNILSDDKFEAFVILWDDRGSGPMINVNQGSLLILHHVIENSFTVRFLGVRSSIGTTSWIIQQISNSCRDNVCDLITPPNDIFIPINTTRVDLSVQALSDAIITFSDTPNFQHPTIAFWLGGDSNTRSFTYENDARTTSVSSPQIMDANAMINFIISWPSGDQVSLFQQSTITPLLGQSLSFTIRYVNVRSIPSNTAQWRIVIR